MSRIGDFFKSTPNYDTFFSNKVDNDETAKIRKEIASLQKKLENKRNELSEAFSMMYSDDFVVTKTENFLYYCGRNNTAYFNLDSLEYFDSLPSSTEERNIIEVNTKTDNISWVIGYSYKLGSVVVRNVKYSISQACNSIKITPIGDYVVPLVDFSENSKIVSYNYSKKILSEETDLRRIDVVRSALRHTKCTEFVNAMYEIDRHDIGGINLYDIFIRKNKVNHEIILKTCPSSLIEAAYSREAATPQPIHKLFNIDRDVYEDAVEYDKKANTTLLYKLVQCKIFLNGLGSVDRSKYNIERTDRQLYDLAVKAENYERDLNFYNISIPTRGILHFCLNVFAKKSYVGSRVTFSEYYTLGKFMNYICTESINQGFTSVDGFASSLRDYIAMVEQCHGTPTLYSSYLKLTHDITSRNMKINVSEEEEKIFASRYSDFKAMQLGDYCVVCPRNTTDIKDEGNELNHCVASYIKRVIDGNCTILFLRLVKEMSKSLVTLEIEGNRIIQARGASNRNINVEERKVLIEYCKKVGYDMKMS